MNKLWIDTTGCQKLPTFSPSLFYIVLIIVVVADMLCSFVFRCQCVWCLPPGSNDHIPGGLVQEHHQVHWRSHEAGEGEAAARVADGERVAGAYRTWDEDWDAEKDVQGSNEVHARLGEVLQPKRKQCKSLIHCCSALLPSRCVTNW